MTDNRHAFQYNFPNDDHPEVSIVDTRVTDTVDLNTASSVGGTSTVVNGNVTFSQIRTDPIKLAPFLWLYNTSFTLLFAASSVSGAGTLTVTWNANILNVKKPKQIISDFLIGTGVISTSALQCGLTVSTAGRVDLIMSRLPTCGLGEGFTLTCNLAYLSADAP